MVVRRGDGYLEVRLRGAPYELGLQHGVALRAEIWSLWGAFRRLILHARGPRIGWALQRTLLGVAWAMERHAPRSLRTELRGGWPMGLGYRTGICCC